MSTSIGTARHYAGAPPPSRTLHHRHDGAPDRHVMSCGASAPRFEAFNLSSENHLNKRIVKSYTSMSTLIAAIYRRVVRSKPKVQNRHYSRS